jgi:hypothetical protein
MIVTALVKTGTGLVLAAPPRAATRTHNPPRRMERWSMRLLSLLTVIGLGLCCPAASSVRLTATFKTLPSGLNHVAYSEVIAPARQLSVQVQNFNYNRNN